MPSPSLRLFVALEPSGPVRAALADLSSELPPAHWTPPEQIHLTLRFIGEVAEERAEAIESALEQVRVRSFLLEPEGVGGFPPRGHPQVLWAGVKSHPFLHQLRQQVDDFLLTVQPELELKPFVPHLTLARCREAPPVAVAHWLKRHRHFIAPVWPVGAFHLMSSELGPTGAAHQVRKKYPLLAAMAGGA